MWINSILGQICFCVTGESLLGPVPVMKSSTSWSTFSFWLQKKCNSPDIKLEDSNQTVQGVSIYCLWHNLWFLRDLQPTFSFFTVPTSTLSLIYQASTSAWPAHSVQLKHIYTSTRLSSQKVLLHLVKGCPFFFYLLRSWEMLCLLLVTHSNLFYRPCVNRVALIALPSSKTLYLK